MSEQLLKQILFEMQSMKSKMQSMKTEVLSVKTEVNSMNSEVHNDIKLIKRVLAN